MVRNTKKIKNSDLVKYFQNNKYSVKKDEKFVFCFYKERFENMNQGWKIHLSAVNNLNLILDKIKKYLVSKKLSFKYVNSFDNFDEIYQKNYDINFNGKSITIYTQNTLEFQNTVINLYVILKEYPPFKIIGDKNYKNSIINYRYGNYLSTRDYYLSINNEKIKDKRRIYLDPKSGYKDPFETRNQKVNQLILNNEYLYLKSLHISNQGVILKCKSIIDDKEYVLKEYRFSNNSRFNMREHEAKVSVDRPKFIKKFNINNSIFYVFEYIDGQNLQDYVKENHIFLNRENNENINKIISKLKQKIMDYHNLGYVLNDIKLDNFVLSNNEIILIDKETLYHKDDSKMPIILNTGLSFDFAKKNLFNRDWQSYINTILNMLNISISVYKMDTNMSEFISYLTDLFQYYNLDINELNFILSKIKQKNFVTKSINLDRNYYLKKLNESYLLLQKVKFDINNITIDNIWEEIGLIMFAFFENKQLLEGVIFKKINSLLLLLDENLSIEILIYKSLYYALSKDKHGFDKCMSIIEKKFLKEDNKNIYLFEKNIYSPYLKNGFSGFVLTKLIGSIVFKNTTKDNDLSKYYNNLCNYNNFLPKTNFLFGFSGVAYTIYHLGKYLNKANYIDKTVEKLVNISYSTYNNIVYSQDVELDNSFFNGNGFIKYFISKMKDITNLLQKTKKGSYEE